jgi:hypothetical protein
MGHYSDNPLAAFRKNNSYNLSIVVHKLGAKELPANEKLAGELSIVGDINLLLCALSAEMLLLLDVPEDNSPPWKVVRFRREIFSDVAEGVDAPEEWKKASTAIFEEMKKWLLPGGVSIYLGDLLNKWAMVMLSPKKNLLALEAAGLLNRIENIEGSYTAIAKLGFGPNPMKKNWATSGAEVAFRFTHDQLFLHLMKIDLSVIHLEAISS